MGAGLPAARRGRDSRLPLPQTHSPPAPHGQGDASTGGNAPPLTAVWCPRQSALLWGRGQPGTSPTGWVLSPGPWREGHSQGQTGSFL